MKAFTTYFTFDGNCREAMTFYQGCFGGDLNIRTFGQGPGETPPGAADLVMHARLSNGTAVLMASDPMPGVPVSQGDNVWTVINCESQPEQDACFAKLAEGGQVVMPLQDTFWNARFGMLRDRFGIQWMLNLEKAAA